MQYTGFLISNYFATGEDRYSRFDFFSWWYINLALMGDGEDDDVDKGKSNIKKVNVTLDMKIVKHERMAIFIYIIMKIFICINIYIHKYIYIYIYIYIINFIFFIWLRFRFPITHFAFDCFLLEKVTSTCNDFCQVCVYRECEYMISGKHKYLALHSLERLRD
jgi:hypothetical protein